MSASGSDENEVSASGSDENKGLRTECEKLWTDIQTAYSEGSKKPASTTEYIDRATEYIDRATEKYLRAALDSSEDNLPEGLPGDEALHQNYGLELFTDRIKNQESFLYLMSLQKKTLTNQLQDITEYQKNLKTVRVALTEASSQRAEAGGSNENGYLKEMKDKLEKLKDERTWLSKRLVDFLQKHYPKPSQPTLDALHSSKQQTAYSLMKIIMNLINRTLNHTHDTYIDIDSRYHPFYVELLKESRIAEAHPSIETKLRLIPHILSSSN